MICNDAMVHSFVSTIVGTYTISFNNGILMGKLSSDDNRLPDFLDQDLFRTPFILQLWENYIFCLVCEDK